MNVLVTGAGGFIGTALAQELLSASTPLGAIGRLALVDQRLDGISADPRVHAIEGDFGDDRVLSEALQPAVDLIFHLASVPGGLAEREFDLGMRVNLHSMIALLEAVRRQERLDPARREPVADVEPMRVDVMNHEPSRPKTSA